MLAEVRDDTVVAGSGPDVIDALVRVDQEWQQQRATAAATTAAAGRLSNPELPFHGGWIGFIGFECGEWIEPAVTRGAAHPDRARASVPGRTALPDLWLARCDAALVHDAATGEWHVVGDETQGRDLLKRAMAAQDQVVAGEECALRLAPIESDAQFESDVRRAIEVIHAGDAFQVNVARRFEAAIPTDVASRRAIGARALGLARYGAYLEVGGGIGAVAGPAAGCALASFSPELFLTVDGATGRVVTRPIKGTRTSEAHAGAGAGAGAARAEFEANAKERAELHMIVDLMRNDLARVCQPRTVRVASARVLEDHPTVLHGVGEVEGTLKDGALLLDILRATFPPGSVTGAPKIRAMQIIRELERAPRGPYCGAIGCLSDCGSMTWSVAIRTAVVGSAGAGAGASAGAGNAARTPAANLTYWAGCGVVAQSDPKAEVAESHAKAAVMGRVK